MTTPWKPGTPARCDGLIIQVGTPGLSRDGASAMARQVVKDTLKGKWRVELLGQNSRMFELLRTQPKTQPLVSQAWQMAADLNAHRDVVFAEVSLVIPGGDPEPRQVFSKSALKAKSFGGDSHHPCSQPDEWSLSLSSVQEAWEMTPPNGKKFGEDILVGHPDTGYTRHPEIFADARILTDKGYDFESNKSDPIDPLKGKSPSHGTSTASVIMSARGLQVPGNPKSVTGVAPMAQLIPIRISTSVVHLSFKNVAKAIYHAIEKNCHVISMSLGGPLGPKYLMKAVEDAIENGIIVLAAAGNIWPFVVYPAKFDEVIAVAACNCKGQPWSGSARGSAVDLTAPGESVWRAKTGKHDTFVTKRSTGTSYAVAAAAGACALWLAYHGRDNLIAQYGKPNLAAVFKELLIMSGVDTPSSWKTRRYGAGILNIKKLLRATLPPSPPAAGIAAIHAGPVSKSFNQFDEITHYFPGVPPQRLMTVLVRMLKTDTMELGAQLATFGDEFIFHIAVNPELRAQIAQRALRKKPTGLGAKSVAMDPLFTKYASLKLKSKLMPTLGRARKKSGERKK